MSQLRRDSSRHPARKTFHSRKSLNRAVSETSAETFKDQHTGHKVECLIAAGERYFPTGQKADPMAGAYIEVTNNYGRYLLRGARKSIEQPLRFSMVKGCLADAGFRLQVQEAALRKAMKHHFGGASAPFGDEKIDGFISLVREVVKEIDPGSVRVSGYSTIDSNIVYGQLGEQK